MAKATYVLEVDWGNDGTFGATGADITAYCQGIQYSRGRDYASQLTGRSTAGRLTANLLNTDGRFNPFNASSPMFGSMLPNRAVRLRTTSPGAYTLWQGFLDSIAPQPQLGGVHLAQLNAVGPLAWINARGNASVAVQTDVLTGTAIGAVLDDVGWSASARSIAAGQTTMSRWWASKNALSALQDIENSEPGFIRESSDGKIVFEDRFTRLLSPYTTSQATFSDDPAATLGYSGITEQDPLKEISNIVTCAVQLYTVDSLAVLWTLAQSGSSSPSISAGASADFWASYPNSGSASNAVGVNAWTTPVASTDFTANSAADGSGTDLTSSITVSVSKFATAMKITLTNGSGSTAYITLLQARGTPIIASDPLTVLTEDATSQGKYGKRTFPIPGPFVPDFATASDFVQFLLSVYKDPIPVLGITVPGFRDSSHLGQVLTREISDRITLTANGAGQYQTKLGLSTDFFIESMSHTIGVDGFHTATYMCSPASAYGGFWVLDTSALDTSTRLAY